jgi:UDP-N-acetyl-D-mannosaminuronic acid transferase (WecB/TagA/CpsF family)
MKKYNLFGVNYNATDYVEITAALIKHAKNRDSVGLTALAVHGLIESYNSETLKEKVNKIDYIVPDGQPIKWALNHFYNTSLKDRV